MNAIKKIKRLIEIKRQMNLAGQRVKRAKEKQDTLLKERNNIMRSFSVSDRRLYRDRIEKATCR